MLNQAFPQRVRWVLGGLVLGDIDAEGREWLVTNDTGWFDGPAPRTDRTARSGDGSFRGRAHRDERIITLEGVCACPSVESRRAAQRLITGICPDGGRLYELVGIEDGHRLAADVEPDSAPTTAPISDTAFRWSVQFAAPDPRLYGPWESTSTGMAMPGDGGVDASPLGVDASEPGVHAGEMANTGVARITNGGNAPTSPLLTIRGPIVRPVVRNVDTGTSLAYSGTLGPAEFLLINTGPFTARGYPGYQPLLGGTANRRSLLTRDGPWPEIPPGESAGFELTADAINFDALLIVEHRQAWY
ncbi:hypothetical protein ABT324_24340 [Saccharopolyspora sp. NPDC000359]|uniref:hypothetical protein n=1 Tax=Saccharopolyspora sp. NPDC000359 TaxID=3154251 RepID=UPI0033247FCD